MGHGMGLGPPQTVKTCETNKLISAGARGTNLGPEILSDMNCYSCEIHGHENNFQETEDSAIPRSFPRIEQI